MFRRKVFIDGPGDPTLKAIAEGRYNGSLIVRLVSLPYGRVTEPLPGHKVWFLVSFMNVLHFGYKMIVFDGGDRYAETCYLTVVRENDDRLTTDRLMVNHESELQLTHEDRRMLLEIVGRLT